MAPTNLKLEPGATRNGTRFQVSDEGLFEALNRLKSWDHPLIEETQIASATQRPPNEEWPAPSSFYYAGTALKYRIFATW
jgi:hypothetical protein